MKMLVLLSVLFAQVAMADVFTYQLYYDQEKTEVLDIKLDIELTGKFDSKSKVVSVKIWGEEESKPVLLFNVPAKNLKYSWSGKVLELSMKRTMKPLIKGEYIPVQSDTFIKEGEEFDFRDLKLNEEGTLESDEEGFFLANQTQEEMGLNGFLKKL